MTAHDESYSGHRIRARHADDQEEPSRPPANATVVEAIELWQGGIRSGFAVGGRVLVLDPLAGAGLARIEHGLYQPLVDARRLSLDADLLAVAEASATESDRPAE